MSGAFHNQRMAHTPAETATTNGLQLVTGSTMPWPLHDAQAARAAEQAALGLHPPHALMQRAGQAVARLALALSPHAHHVHIWAGPGNNGGDGLVAARLLHSNGCSVAVSLVGDTSRMPTDAAQALGAAQDAGVAIESWTGATPRAALHVDALLGLGANRAPTGPLAHAIQALNSQLASILAVDLPSGLNADTGMPLGDCAVRAQNTLALLSLKPGCHTGQGRDHAGTVWLDRLGVPASGATAWLSGAPQATDRLHAAHKGSFGDVAVVGGAPGMAGAAWLAARAALAAGAGRVYACLLDEGAAQCDMQRPELMTRGAWWLSAAPVLAATTVVCGCGGGDRVRAALPTLLSHAGRLVLDADALNAVAEDTALATLLARRAGRGLGTLLTPHPLEAARLLHTTAALVQQDRLAAAHRLAAQLGATVLLKGSGTVIAAPGQNPCINATGNAALSTAGTGDVLAGWCGGLWAQAPNLSAAEVAIAAAWLHGRAADTSSASSGRRRRVLQASDLVQAMADLAAH